ncbi:MAG: type II secretory ATPase GspE/PulE/Tfp pilus assembly ATPase PilB-like protein [Verrucomicrobiales bacterium]|jgi:type II secretory ATPase GspE/PulE/Tfp pilus assembly ATPase PilB-like protein
MQSADLQSPDPPQGTPDSSNPELYALDSPAADLLVSIEGTAVQFGILPIELGRETCTADAEDLVRLLGRAPSTASPWLPVAKLGPLVIVAHHNPKSDDCWGIPDFLTIKVVISAGQYENVKRDLVRRISTRPLPTTSQYENLAQPSVAPGDLAGAFRWFADNYPQEERVGEQLRTAFMELLDKIPEPGIGDFNGIQAHLGIALHSIASTGPTLVFNPDEAPRQSRFPISMLEKHGVYPVYCGSQRVYLLSETLDNYSFEDEWLSSGNDPVELVAVLADGGSIQRAINKNSGATDAVEIEIDETGYQISDDANLVEIIPEEILSLDPNNVNNQPEEILHWILFQAIQQRSSDLHLEKYYNTGRFRARVDGQLKTIFAVSEELLPRYIALLKNYSNLGQSRQETQDGRFAIAINQRRIDVRVAAVPCRREMQKIIMRFLDKEGGLKSMSDLHLSERQTMMLDQTMGRDQGLILITGPTGSGKTTTLYALLNSINSENVNIHTIEDPIEYRLEGINQTQTDPVHHINFGSGLRALLRSDPDVILIGECRDEETATSAVNSALTGHLVLTTLHANDSLRAISRLLSMGVPNYLLADSLVLSQAQRLVRRLCRYCKRPVPITEEFQQVLTKFEILESPIDSPIYEKAGCDECHQTGYNGRIALMEMCEITQELKDLISDEAPMRELRKIAHRNGLFSLYQEGLCHVVAGNTTVDEIKGLS